jgi:hypothetical protein
MVRDRARNSDGEIGGSNRAVAEKPFAKGARGGRIRLLSFPKIPSGRIRALRENQGSIRRDACHAPSAWDVCRQPVQVAAPA